MGEIWTAVVPAIPCDMLVAQHYWSWCLSIYSPHIVYI
jgi:hypothetical protein